MSQTNGFDGLKIIGDRINPGFKSTKALMDANDMEGIQALAVKQVEAGAEYLDITVGRRAKEDPKFLIDVIKAVQEVVAVPLCMDEPEVPLQRVMLEAYDQDKAGGQLPLVNSVVEPRYAMMQLYKEVRPFKVILLTSERVEDGVNKTNRSADEVISTAKRVTRRMQDEYGVPLNDIFIDVQVVAVCSDSYGQHRAAHAAVQAIHTDPEMQGVHMMGGLTNVGQMLPPKAVDGSDLKLCLENVFLTRVVPHGFDYVLATPWRQFSPIPADHYVSQVYDEFLQATGTDALRKARKFYKAGL
ncbi:MAG: dihydropteroate synthase [Gammaproteobacteria bacterium]|nr:dihydropteroate synthase [Gammaproteobacteria bacterium]